MMRKHRLKSQRSKLLVNRTRRQAARSRSRGCQFAGSVESLEPRQLLAADPVISEFVALNSAIIQDEDGAYSDWLEIQNRGDTVANISGYFLTDDTSDLNKWQIPAGTSVAPGEAIVVFASGKDRTGAELHTNFTLDELGGDLALVAADGSTVISDFFGHPALGRDQPYGSFLPTGATDYVRGFMSVPTPGADNSDVDPIISEFLADNNAVMDDEDGDSSDWVELHNPGVADVDLTGWYLSDDVSLSNKWQFPQTTLGAGEYLIVFASGKDRAVPNSELHTNFRISASGDYLALVKPDGITVVSDYAAGGQPFGEQFNDVSFGVRGSEKFAVGENDPVKGLIAYWNFEEGTGTTLTDVTGNGFDGTITNMETGDWVAGRKAGTTALNFDGADEFISTGATASALDIPGRASRTMAGWVRSPIFFQGKIGGVFEVGSPANDFSFRSTSILGSTWATEYGDTRIGTTVTANTWFHFATTYDGTNVKLYINGELVGDEESLDLFTDDGAPFTIGKYESNFYKGQIDDLAVWDMPLAADVIADLAAETLTPQTVPTISRLIGVDRNRFSVRQVNAVGQVGSGANPLAEVDALLALPAGNPGIAEEFTFSYDLINFYDTGAGGDNGLFGADEAFVLDDEIGDDDDFAIHATAVLVVPEGSAGNFIFAVSSDDGSRLRIDGADVIVDNALHAVSTQTGTINLAAGEHDLDLVYFERSGGASLELLYASLNEAGVQEGDFALVELLPDQRTPDVAPPVTLAPRVFFPQPTPGAANNVGVDTFVSTTTLSVPHGFYDAPFQLEITNATPNVDIWYTLNGTEPSPDNLNALLYAGPMTISSTTVLRAAAFKENAAPSKTATASYFFIDDILTQSPDGQRPAGVPTSWNPGSTPSAWGMDPDIVNSPTWGPLMEQALTQIPTMSLIMDLEDIFGAEGIYTRAGNRGRAWERPSSLELIYPDGTGPDDGFQINAGVRVRGGFSRSNDNPKHAFRFFFRQEYGESKLNYALFGDEGVNQFDKIDLRTTQNYSWSFQNDARNVFLRDIFSRDLQLAMGQPSTRGEYYHMYVNGMYWGLFQTEERPGASYAADNHGGVQADWDVVHNEIGQRQLGAIDGTIDSTQRLHSEFIKPGGLSDANMADYYRVQGYNLDGTRNPEYERMLDVDNLIDYMVITYYTSDADGPGSKFTRPQINNYYAIYNRENPDGWKFMEHDSEHSLDTGNGASANYNMVSPLVNNGATLGQFNGHWMHEQLANTNSDYRQHFIDRVTNYMKPGGLLDPVNVQAMLQSRADQFDMAIIAESARWGDAKRAAPYTKNDWNNAVQTTLNFVIGRNENLLNQFRCAGSTQVVPNPDPATCTPSVRSWYPNFKAPLPNPVTGVVSAGSNVRLTVPGNAEVVERTFVTSSVLRSFVPANGNLGLSWTEPGFADASWGFGTGDVGYESDTGYENLIKKTVPAGTTSVYVRPFIKFSVSDDDGDGDLTDEWDELTLGVRYDDGFIAYLNGVEVARANAPENPTWNSVATASHDDAAAVQLEQFVLNESAKALLLPSGNVLAVHGLNVDATSSDFLIGYELRGRKTIGNDVFPGEIYYTVDGTDPRKNNGGAIDPNAVRYNPGENIVIDENTLLTARSRFNGEWSALTQEFYQVALPTVGISEINYNPHDPTAVELAIDADLANDDFEFIEIVNTGSTPAPLAGLHFTTGIDATLPAISLLPGQRGVIVKNQAAFELRYGSSVNVLATFNSGGLNNGGEQLVLSDGLGMPVLDLTYNDADPWPSAADGVGGTLEFIGSSGASYSKYSSWRSSTDFGGSPGTAGSNPIGVVINEVLAHTDPPVATRDSIELKNTTSSAINIGGWYLSDAAGDLLKYAIPANTMLPAGEYIVFNESHFNPTPATPGENDFALSGVNGDDVYLVIPDGSGSVSKLVDDVHFIASKNGESFGRTPDGTGRLAPMSSVTLGTTNSAPRVGPLVISELNYAPENPSASAVAADPNVVADDLEFVEIHNPTLTTVDLKDWRIRGGIDIDFVAGTTITSGETVVVVSFNPDNPDNASRLAAFRAHYGINTNVRLIGGYNGELSNNDERVQLQRPDEPAPNDPLNIPRVIEDEVLYDASLPWPTTSNGRTLQRVNATSYGNAVASWSAASPTLGSVSFDGVVHGDFDGNGTVGATDIDLLSAAILSGDMDPRFDLDGNGTVAAADRTYMVRTVLGTFLGDANLDGAVTAADLNAVGLNWQGNGGWADGDFNGDGNVDVRDLNAVGINWQNGVAAPAVRAPRAALGAVIVVDRAIVDLNSSVEATGSNAMDSVTENSSRRRDGLTQRRWSRSSYRSQSLVDVEESRSPSDETGLIDNVFADLF